MREIKFRAWDKDYKYMNHKVMVGNVWDEENYHAHMIWVDRKDVDYECESGWMNFDEHSNIELMQYTGLKDKNGTEIYEGDIVKFYDFWDELTGGREKGQQRICRVEYVGSGFLVVQGDEDGYEQDLFMAKINDDDLEVIGNIYENPELLLEDE